MGWKYRTSRMTQLYYDGLNYETQGNVAAAQADYEKVLKLNPNYKTAEIALSRVKAGGKL